MDISAVSHTFIGHKDFLPLRHAPSKLAQCKNCRTIFISEKSIFPDNEDIYHGESYTKEKKPEHIVFEQKSAAAAAPRTSYSYFAELIKEQIRTNRQKPTLKFLDVGCFDGKLLVELKKDFADATMHGFDVSDHIGEIFPKAEDFAFYTGTLDNVQGTYDIIIIANVLAYVDDLQVFAKHIERLLAQGGIVFYACADVKKNPYFFTCGDQYTYQTPANLTNFWAHFGYAVEFVDTKKSFPRSVIGFARREAIRAGVSFEADDTLRSSLSYLGEAAKILREAIAAHQNHHPSGRIAILGCTNNEAWAHNLAGAQIACFVDEHPSRIGRTFYGKPVVHPRDLVGQYLLIAPYGTTAQLLADKFGKLYKAEIFPI